MRINREKLAVAMVRRDLSVKRLAALTGLSRATITAVRTGKSCSADTAAKLAAILGPGVVEGREK